MKWCKWKENDAIWKNLISNIHEYKRRQSYLLDSKKNVLEALLKVAKIKSTSSSNKIEGISTTDKRINEIVNQKLEPKNRNEEEIAGYRDVLSLIHENYKFIDVTQNTILQLHRDLYKYTGYSYGGKFKNFQNYIEEENEKGERILNKLLKENKIVKISGGRYTKYKWNN